MKLPRINPTSRQISLCVIAGAFLLCVALLQAMVFPAYDELAGLGKTAEARAAEYARLSRNLAAGKVAQERFASLGKIVNQTASDEATLSEFLRELELLARRPSLRIVNIKPVPVDDQVSHRIYRANMTMAGKVQDLLQFASEITDANTVEGLDNFTIRGVQGISMVECSLVIRMVRTIDAPTPPVRKKRTK
jgi:Tfp pilus assembly protein PilO